MKSKRIYNYSNRTLAMWYYNRILEGKGSYYSIYKRISEDPTAKITIINLMKYMDEIFCDRDIKIALIKKAILYILGTSPDRPLSRKEIIGTVISRLEISPMLLEESTEKGNKSSLESEIGWEIYHLLEEGRITRVSKGYYTIH